jgi:5-methylthioadenosine/S-adenosylhomocysteine deaminase
MSLLLRRPTVITLNDRREIRPDCSLLIEEGKISRLIAGDEPLPAADRVLAGEGRLVLPGFVNTHTHAAMTLLRGYADDMELQPWLQEKIWPLEAKLQPEDIYWGTLLAIAEMLRAGVTCFNDMYFSPEKALEACRETGIRAGLSGVLLGTVPNAEADLRHAVKFLSGLKQEAPPTITPMLAPHAPYTCPDALLRPAIAAAREIGLAIHTHLSETKKEVEESLAQHGKTPIAHMDQLGMFDGPAVAAHCVWATEADIAILAEKKVGVAHAPGSNMKLAAGAMPARAMLAAGVPVGLGTDGAASNNNLDVLEEARLAALLAKLETGDPTAVSAYQALYMATRGGAEALGLGDKIGQIAPGFCADIIMLDLTRPHLYPQHDLVSQIIYSARAGDVCGALVAGKPLLWEGELQTLEEPRVLAEAAGCARRLVNRV